jgi:propionyl-CoA synthetase
MEKAAMIDGRDVDWDEAMEKASPRNCVPVAATDPLYILYTSGTTGMPKGIVRDNGGHMVALYWTMKNIYDVDAGDVYWAASDVGWVVGHSYIVYGPLSQGLHHHRVRGQAGGHPGCGRVLAGDRRARGQGAVHRAHGLPGHQARGPGGELIKKYDLSNFKALFLAGERTDPDTYHWATDCFEGPVIDHWWQTETAWAICANFWGCEFPVKEGSAHQAGSRAGTCRWWMPGQPGGPGRNRRPGGQAAAAAGNPAHLWQNDERYVESYLEISRAITRPPMPGFIDEDGYAYIMSRTDDIINVAGHRLSTGAMEEVISDHPDVAECAVLGVDDSLKGQVPVGLVVLKAGVTKADDEIVKEVIQMVRDRIGPVAAFKTATVVKRLPKTRSGKILRGTIQKIADNKAYNVPATIDDPTILGEMEEALEGIGYAKARKS